MQTEKILAAAQEAALKAGAYLKENYGQLRRPEVELKGEIDLVTKHDRKSQQIIYDLLKENFPRHSFLSEEDLKVENEKELLWVIDPLDGTTNYAQSLPVFSVSIAFLLEGIPRVGVVYAPLLQEMFHAVKGGGAFLNGKPLAVSRERELGNSVLGTGFPYDIRESSQNNIEHFSRFLLKTRALRRMGSAAIDVAYTAAGRFDGFWELKLLPWDIAAAMLMVQEAGGEVTDFAGNPFDPFKRNIVASNRYIHEQMLRVLRENQDGTD
jgi:myo-inositol-1(or 4)-monophosphatase